MRLVSIATGTKPLQNSQVGRCGVVSGLGLFSREGANYVGTETNVTGKCSIGVQGGGLGVTKLGRECGHYAASCAYTDGLGRELALASSFIPGGFSL